MFSKFLLVLPFVLLAAASLGCGVSEQLIALINTPTLTATATATATPTSTPTFTPTFTPTSTNTPTVTPTPNLTAAIITLNDLPPGFEALSDADLARANLSGFQSGNQFGNFTDARPRNLFVFARGAPRLVLVFGVLYYPLSPLDRVSFDNRIASPDVARELATYMTSRGYTVKSSSTLPGAGNIGDGSTGVTMAVTSQTTPLQFDLVMVRRGTVGSMIMLAYEGSSSSVSVTDLARALDSRIAAGFGIAATSIQFPPTVMATLTPTITKATANLDSRCQTIPAQFSGKKPPYSLDDGAAIAAGRQTWDNLCVACHGATGKGDGPAVAALNPKPRNEADSQFMQSIPIDCNFYLISEGNGNNMPPWRTLGEDKIWKVLIYQRSLSGAK